MSHSMSFRILATLALAALASPALAADPTGMWLRETGLSRIRIAPCGEALCGTIAWLKNPDTPAKVGQRVLFGMKPTGDSVWKGSAFNPEDGKTYSGEMTLSGNRLTTSGCALGGLICKTVHWTRVE